MSRYSTRPIRLTPERMMGGMDPIRPVDWQAYNHKITKRLVGSGEDIPLFNLLAKAAGSDTGRKVMLALTAGTAATMLNNANKAKGSGKKKPSKAKGGGKKKPKKR